VLHRRLLWIAVALHASTLTAYASFFDGNGLHNLCKTSRAFANGYITGATDFNDMNMAAIGEDGKVVVPKKFICIPPGTIVEQVTDVACKYLLDHPEERQLPAPVLVYKALLQAWQCPKQ